MSSDDTPYDYEQAGKALNQRLETLTSQLTTLEGDIDQLKEEVGDTTVPDHTHEEYLTKDEVIALIAEHDTGGLTESEVIGLIDEHGAGFPEDRLEAIDQEIANIREAIGMIRGGVTSTIGPDVPDADGGYFHSTPGWGAVVTITEPRQFRECTVVSNQDGEFTAELWEFDGDAGALVDSTTIEVISDGEHDVDLDLQAPEAGTYLLTRDYESGRSTISLWRTTEDWDGWGDVDQSLTLHNSAHPDFGGEPLYFYYFFECDVLPYYPDGGQDGYGAEYGDDYGNGQG